MRLVDADALLDKLDSICVEKMNSKKPCPLVCTLCPLSDMLDVIEDAPTVDAAPVRHGRWIFNPKDAIEMMFTLPKCSECGAESPNGGNYCPSCWARMDIKYGKD